MITPDATAEQEDGDRLVGGPIRECAGKLLDLIVDLDHRGASAASRTRESRQKYFTVVRCGAKAKLWIFTSVSAACTGAAGKVAAAARTAAASAVATQMLLTIFVMDLGFPPQRCSG
jgi:hypothetical protein